MAELKFEIEAAEADVRARREELEKRIAHLDTLDAKSPPYTELSEQITSAQSQLLADIRSQQNDVVRKETLIFADTYEDMEATCQRYAKSHGAALIFRLSENELNRNEPQSIVQHVHRPIVWYDGSLDITRIILDAMIESAKSEAPAPAELPAPATPRPPATPEGTS